MLSTTLFRVTVFTEIVTPLRKTFPEVDAVNKESPVPRITFSSAFAVTPVRCVFALIAAAMEMALDAFELAVLT
jgi:hypothetical protein